MEYAKRRKPERMFKMISILKKSDELIKREANTENIRYN
jgi:hypothetical protein